MTLTAVDQVQVLTRAASPRAMRHGTIDLRSGEDIDQIAAAGAVVAAALCAGEGAARIGARTCDIDAAVRAVIAAHGAEPAFLNYPNPLGGQPFPAACCTSINEEVVHGLPGARTLVDGDLVSIDVGVRLNGWNADAAVTVAVGQTDVQRQALIACAWDVLHGAIAMMEPGRRWSDIAARMQETAIGRGCGVVDGWLGHGIGRAMHEAPQVPCMVSAGLREQRDFTLLPGMVLAVEPLLVLGGGCVIDADGCAAGVPAELCADGWTVAVADGRPAVHVEHTVAVTRMGPRVLTGPETKAHGGGRR